MTRITSHAAILIAIFTTANLAAAPAKKKAANPNAALIAKARSATTWLLRDPGSAQFRNIRVVPDMLDNKVVCGEVNSKNGFGGYGGFVPFVFNSRAAILDGDHKAKLDYFSLANACATDFWNAR